MVWGIFIVLLGFVPTLKPGWPVSIEGGNVQSPTVFDIDKDGTAEVVVASRGIWIVDPGKNSCEVFHTLGDTQFTTKPAVGDAWDATPGCEIAVGRAYQDYDSIWAYLLNRKGDVLRNWPVNIGWMTVRTRLGPPTLIDVEDDGLKEVIFPSSFGPHVIDGNGNIFIPTAFGPGLLGGDILVTDLENDGKKEFIVLTDPIRIVDLEGNILCEFPSMLDTIYRGVICDLDGDSKDDMVLFGKMGSNLALNALDLTGDPLCGWPYVSPLSAILYIPCGLSVGDLNRDGKLEVLYSATSIYNGVVYALDREAGPIPDERPIIKAPGYPGTPLVADLGGKGLPKVIVQICGVDNVVRVYAGDLSGTVQLGWPINVTSCVCIYRIMTPAVTDIEGDGRADLVVVSPNGVVFAYEISDRSIKGGWLQERGDAANTCRPVEKGCPKRLKWDRVRITDNIDDGKQWKIYNVSGRMLGFCKTGNGIMEAGFNELPTGIYIFRRGARYLKVLKLE